MTEDTMTPPPVGGYEIPAYNRQGVRISLDEWAMLYTQGRSAADPVQGYHRIAYDTIGSCLISTVWLGFDLSHRDGGPAQIFETLIHDGCPDSHEVILRYATEDEARANHAAIVARVSAAYSAANFLTELDRILGRDESE